MNPSKQEKRPSKKNSTKTNRGFPYKKTRERKKSNP